MHDNSSSTYIQVVGEGFWGILEAAWLCGGIFPCECPSSVLKIFQGSEGMTHAVQGHPAGGRDDSRALIINSGTVCLMPFLVSVQEKEKHCLWWFTGASQVERNIVSVPDSMIRESLLLGL